MRLVLSLLASTSVLSACIPSNALSIDDDGDGYTEFDGDCDDRRPDIYPGSVELCDDLDNDCDGQIDAEDPSLDLASGATFYADLDGDGFGDPGGSTVACFRSPGIVDNADDCDDSDPTRRPGATEICDDIDNDCDGSVDDDDPDVDLSTQRTWYRDLDQDGYGVDTEPTEACSRPENYSAVGGDCDDAAYDVHPDALERCDDIDNDCDTLVDGDDPSLANGQTWYADLDEDGYGDTSVSRYDCTPLGYETETPGDCNDGNGDVFPTADERCNGIDDDCDTEVDEPSAVDAPVWWADADTDGYGDALAAMTACSAPAGHVANADDCDDSHDGVWPGAPELCDGLDNDCDLAGDATDPDTIPQNWFLDGDGDGFGEAGTQVYTCPPPGPNWVAEGTDCDDSDSDAFPGATWYLDADGDGYGDPSQDMTTCLSPPNGVANAQDCDDGDGNEYPGVNWYPDIDGDGFGDPNATPSTCARNFASDVADATDCDDADSGIYPGAPEIRADGLDQDCDGQDVVWSQVSVGDNSAACALDTNGGIACWGYDYYGQVSDAPTGTGYQHVSMGENHACAVTSGGWVTCWGRDAENQCYTPVFAFDRVNVDEFMSCGLRANGNLFCWGSVPHPTPSGSFVDVQTGYNANCGQYANGVIACWSGYTNTSATAIVTGTPSGSFETLGLGEDAACVLNSAGALTCWGNDGYVVNNAPSAAFGPFDAVAVGESNACAIDTTGALFCWGSAGSLQSEPAGVWASIDVALYYACVISTTGDLECWGNNSQINAHP